MRRAYKTLTYEEFNVLNKVIKKTGLDCWAAIKQDCHGVDYIYDMEERKRMCLTTGVCLIAEALDCQENFDNCGLEDDERKTLLDLFLKLNIVIDPAVDWKL